MNMTSGSADLADILELVKLTSFKDEAETEKLDADSSTKESKSRTPLPNDGVTQLMKPLVLKENWSGSSSSKSTLHSSQDFRQGSHSRGSSFSDSLMSPEHHHEQRDQIEELFARLIEMSSVPDNAPRIIASDGGLDTLVATVYPESCAGCGSVALPHIFHPSRRAARRASAKALCDVYRNVGDVGRDHYKIQRHATHLLHVLEGYMDVVFNRRQTESPLPSPLQTLAILTKMSFEGKYRTPMNDLGLIFLVAEYVSVSAISELLELSEAVRYGCTILTNLTCGDHHVKSALAQLSPFLHLLLSFLHDQEEEDEETRRAIISLFRNLSWRASTPTKRALLRAGTCRALLGLHCTDFTSLKLLTSALWNLSAHSNENKEVMCTYGLRLISELISDTTPRNTAVLENTLGILRNISSNIAQVRAFRAEVRESGILVQLVALLHSNNDTIISTAAGALWNLSARSPTDQELLKEHDAVPALRALTAHPDKSIRKSAAGALRNLTSSSSQHSDSSAKRSLSPTQFWLDDYSLVSSGDSASRHSPQARRKVEGRKSSERSRYIR